MSETITYDRGDQIRTFAPYYRLPPEPKLRRCSSGSLEHRAEWSQEVSRLYDAYWQQITDDVQAFGVNTRPADNPGNRPSYDCGYYHIWYIGNWQTALFHPVRERYCNHVAYPSLIYALNVLIDLQQQPLASPDFESTLVWNQPGEGNTAHYEHFQVEKEAKARLGSLREQGLVDEDYKPLLIPYQLPYTHIRQWRFIENRPISWLGEGDNRTHHLFAHKQ